MDDFTTITHIWKPSSAKGDTAEAEVSTRSTHPRAKFRAALKRRHDSLKCIDRDHDETH